jgi:hypothetical protein
VGNSTGQSAKRELKQSVKSAERMTPNTDESTERQLVSTGGKRKDREENPMWEPRKTRGRCTNYRRLNDPFSDDKDNTNLSEHHIYVTDNLLGDDDPKSLAEVKASPDWPEWENQ